MSKNPEKEVVIKNILSLKLKTALTHKKERLHILFQPMTVQALILALERLTIRFVCM